MAASYTVKLGGGAVKPEEKGSVALHIHWAFGARRGYGWSAEINGTTRKNLLPPITLHLPTHQNTVDAEAAETNISLSPLPSTYHKKPAGAEVLRMTPFY